jgi:hypothetical protein
MQRFLLGLIAAGVVVLIVAFVFAGSGCSSVARW